jgi:hypothetical protein
MQQRKPRKRAKPSAKQPLPVPCQYDCGRTAEGILSVDFTPHDDDPLSFRRAFRVAIPACRTCLRAAVKVAICIPEVVARKGDGP